MSRVPFLAPPLLYVPPTLWFKQTPLMLTKASLRQLQHLPSLWEMFITYLRKLLVTLPVNLPGENINVCPRSLLWKSAKSQHFQGWVQKGEEWLPHI